MKRIIIISIISILLSGCTKIEYIKPKTSINNNLITDKVKESHIDKLSGWNRAEINKLEKLSISFDYNGDKQEVYKSKEGDFIVVGHTEHYLIYNDITEIPPQYINIIKDFRNCSWHYTGCTVGGYKDIINFMNDEFIIVTENSGYYPFSNGNAVLNSDNIPINITLHICNNIVTKIYIDFYDISYQKKELSDKNMTMLKDAFKLTEISDIDSVISQFEYYINNNKIQKSDFNEFNISSINPVDYCKNIKVMGIIVTLK